MPTNHISEFKAIAIDNNILKGHGYKFNEGVLKQLSQYRDLPTAILVPEVVHFEARKHIANEINNAVSKVNAAFRSVSLQLDISPDVLSQAEELLCLPRDPLAQAEAKLEAFYTNIGALQLKVPEDFDMAYLMNMYFSIEPPFEDNKNKRKEFPDAVALLNIEKWAEENDGNVLLVSQDKGWNEFCSDKPRLENVDSLSEALQRLLPQTTVSDLVRSIHESQFLAQEHHIIEEVDQAIIKSCDDIYFNVDASSEFMFESDEEQLLYSDHSYTENEDGQINITIVRIEDSTIVIKLSAVIYVDANATFYFSVKDGIDKDYFQIGSSTEARTENYRTDVLITLEGDFTQGTDSLDVADIEILNPIKHVDFGYITPDLDRYDYD
ncbi:PIN domain-containing protein [Vibrio cyclitrophicus]|uniref:PIN domain-containing protein n=1 Tax=Vibrio cyclitrophicus TaxID=47951 RepID=UPI0007EECA30|nr:PIN domain-containing protein [Vibrio cyclitrophicus]